MDDNIILSLQNEFRNEATNAPMLFKDLAKVEQYIAESYKTRSFIELIQNADDANSNKFGIHIYDKFVIVGNDGRDFNYDDVKAICRSGSSNKVRGGDTIGYRGIGFKSVVNLAERVFILSNDINFMYDKKLTQKILNIADDVPLIRIPHLIESIPNMDKIKGLKEKYGYKTIFLFDNIKENVVEEELQQFDKSSVLFLNSVHKIYLENYGKKREITKQYSNNICKISENSNTEEWMIISYNNKYDKLAFKIENNMIISANVDESVIHSFTPTTESSGGYFKMNGNFSTDPSRKNIDFDDISEKSFYNCCQMITNIIMEILNGNNNYIGFFKPFTEFNNAISSNKIRSKLIKQVSFNLKQNKEFETLRLKPEMISIEDYNEMCKDRFFSIKEETQKNYPEINVFFELLDIKYLTLEEMIECIRNELTLSEVCLATILAKIIKKYRYDFSSQILEKLKNIKIFITKDGQVDSKKLIKYSDLSEKYKQILIDNCDIEDIRFVFKKLEIEYDNTNAENDVYVNENTTKLSIFSNIFKSKLQHSNKDDINEKSDIVATFEKKRCPNIQKWRSTEMNFTEYLKCYDIVDDVKDVSVSNLGYDLEVQLTNGKKIYIEVKSMVSFSQPFKITNNEYTCAHNYGDDYYIALVINDDNFTVRFIKNPIENLHFEKKCEQWSWLCEEYKLKLLEISNI